MDEGYAKHPFWFLSRINQIRYLPCGSFFERPLRLIFSDLTDIDILVSPVDLCAIPPEETVPSYFRRKTKVLTIYTSGVHAGFAKLMTDTNDNQFFRRSDMDRGKKTPTWETKLHGPSVMKIVKIRMGKKAANFLESLSHYDSSLKHMTQFKIDEVEAIHCPCWPPEAAEWVTRKRENSWPSSSDIEKVVNGGCHFVAKPHQSNPNDATQWRFSFSQAELILIHSWTDVQMQIYHLLRLVKSEVVKNCGGDDSAVLSTYFFKTLMLWACEEKPREFWKEMNLETSFMELIAKMVEWLIDRRCPNYFIPSNNMIDYLSDDIDLSKEIEFLLKHGDNCVRSLSNRMSKTYPRDEFSISCSNKTIIHLLIKIYYHNVIDSLDKKINNRMLEYLRCSREFLRSIRYLYLGILSHVKMMNLRRKYLLKNTCEFRFVSGVSDHLEKAMEFSEFGNTEVLVSLSDTTLDLVQKLITQENSTRGYSSGAVNFAESSSTKDSGISLILRLILSRVMNDIDNYLPTPLFLVAAAYRANFLFTGAMDYKAATKLCDDVARLLRENREELVWKEFGRNFMSLPFIIRSEWSAIFDDDIQVVFGFVSLYQRISEECLFGARLQAYGDEHGSVVLELSAWEFLHYIRYRCQRKLGDERDYLKPPPMRLMKLNPMFYAMHIADLSGFILCAAAHLGSKFDLDSNKSGV